MGTSRTGTAAYKQWRRRVIALARARGEKYCPDCGREMNFIKAGTPRSAEPDHVIPWSKGGQNTIENARVVCRWCNQRRGNKPIPEPRKPVSDTPNTVGVAW